MEILDLIQRYWNAFTLGTAALFILYLGYKEVWMFGSAARREVLAERKIAEAVIQVLQAQLKLTEERLILCQKELERSQVAVIRGNLIAEKTVQMAEQLHAKVLEDPKEQKS